MLEGLTPAKNRAIYCRIAEILDTLEPQDKEILETALADEKLWSANGLSLALRHRGVSVADTTISRHRNRVCACYRG